MQRYSQLVIQFYSRLLRFYPAQFRAEYADEMQDVFAQAVGENENSLFALLLAEVRDLPFRVLEEHMQERRKRVLAANTGVIVMQSGLSVQIFRVFSYSLLIVLAVFALMVVLPFFALGLQTQTHMEVISGSLGPEAFLPYRGASNLLPRIAVFVLMAAPAWDAIFGGGLLLMLLWFWKRLSARYRLMGIVAVAAAITPTLFMFLPQGSIMFSWWMN